MHTQHTVLMDRTRSRVSLSSNYVASVAPAAGTEVFYVGKKYSKKIGIASGRTGIVDGPPVKNSGGISVSFARLPPTPKPGEESGESELDRSPEAFILSASNLRPVPPVTLARKEEARKAAAEKRRS